MKYFLPLSLCLLIFIQPVMAVTAGKDSLQLLKAASHPMQYYISLPEGWTKEKTWPVVMVIEASDKEYRENALRFVRERQNMPFIIVDPYNVNNSRSGRRDPKIFPYSSETWDYIERIGDCRFNLEGLNAVMKDVQEKCNGEEKYYITGFEAGAHTVWQMAFQHPEKLKAVAAVASNYNQNSCMQDPSSFSSDLSRVVLPLMEFSPELDSFFGPHGVNYNQWKKAEKLAMEHGYKKVSEIIVKGKGHVPLPKEVMQWFFELLTEEKKE